MSDRITLVVHAAADEAYAADLALDLQGLMLCVAPGGLSTVQFGAGVVCIVVWSEALEAQRDDVLGALIDASVVFCCLNGLRAPMGFSACEAQGASAVDAAAVNRVLDAVLAKTADRAPALRMGAPGASFKTPKQHLAVRSAYGVAATLAVAGFIAPSIMERAQSIDASAATPTAAPVSASGPGAARAAIAATLAQQAEPAPQVSSTPAVDRWLAPPAADADDTPEIAERVAFASAAIPLAPTFDLAPPQVIEPPSASFAHAGKTEPSASAVEASLTPAPAQSENGKPEALSVERHDGKPGRAGLYGADSKPGDGA